MRTYSLKTLLAVTMLVALATWYLRPSAIVLVYSIEIPGDLPETVKVSRGLGKGYDELDAEEWYRRWHREGWQVYLLTFLSSPNYTDANDPVEDRMLQDNVFSDDPPFELFWPIGDIGRTARLDGQTACRLELRRLAQRYGIADVKNRLKLYHPGDEDESWCEMEESLGHSVESGE